MLIHKKTKRRYHSVKKSQSENGYMAKTPAFVLYCALSHRLVMFSSITQIGDCDISVHFINLKMDFLYCLITSTGTH